VAQSFNWTVQLGSTQNASFVFQNADGTPYNIVGMTWEYVVRLDGDDSSLTPLIKVTTTANAQGVLSVNTGTATVSLTLNPAATANLPSRSLYAHTLWGNPGTTTATAWVTGQFLTSAIAQP
jgi:hypothetical protein